MNARYLPGVHAQFDHFLLALKALATTLNQQRDLDRLMLGADVLDDLKFPMALPDDLDRRGSRPSPHLSRQRHPISIPNRPPRRTDHQITETRPS